MAETITVDICVIGAGSGGLSVAAGASQMGADVALIERDKMGGDCLNYGCVPSKALIAAGHTAHIMRHADRFGVQSVVPAVDYGKVRDHVRSVIAAIEPNDSVERYNGLGVNVIKGEARFVGPGEAEADGRRIKAKRFVIATGSAAMVPPIPGLDMVPYLTNETVFDLDTAPKHLIVIGGGPIGAELAQAHRRLGAAVTVVEMFDFLGKDDPELTEVVRHQFAADGVDIRAQTAVTAIERDGDSVVVVTEKDGQTERISGSHLLIAAGRQPNLDELNLEAAGVAYDRKGIEVDARLRTTNRKIFAIGDVAGPYQFTHMAGYHAGIVIRNALFKLPAKVDYRAVPWVTYTDPELAHVGMTEAQVKESQPGDFNILRWPFHENDRAQAERETEGLIKVVTGKKGRVLGATIVGPHAGELLSPWIMAVSGKQKIGTMAGLIAPYPTLGEVGKRAAGSYYTPSLFSERTRKIVRFLLKF
ncbi:MAG: dihydrolipoamide dehydrogenase [Alphaproteobacteria bacterium]|nr:dihydrolipoamide dehydrogenase [Alphaproteobacteria bacterium]